MSGENEIKLLLVDDEVKFLKAIADRFELKGGFNVTTAVNGEQAIEAAKEGGFDVAVIDLQMPGMDGAEVLKILKANHEYLEIIMLTGHATVDSAVECTRLGAFNYLEKPYGFEKLTEAIKDAYETLLKKKFQHNEERMKQIQKLSMGGSPLGILQALAKMDKRA